MCKQTHVRLRLHAGNKRTRGVHFGKHWQSTWDGKIIEQRLGDHFN